MIGLDLSANATIFKLSEATSLCLRKAVSDPGNICYMPE